MTDGTEDLTDPKGTEPAAEGAVDNPYATIPPSDQPAAVNPVKRPTSLRPALDEPAVNVPRRTIATPPAPSDAAVSRREPPTEALQPDEPATSPFDPVFERLATAQERAAVLASERPEVVVGAAFAGGLILAAILKRLGRR